ncbi:CLUMA_CG016193, isoform A [Clunio marinus]|uniref:CLUMA_CG016193, isoform A n=1 Tax=Clunio marinus TaxID=568069 RepID=A0A1J1IUE5_9DIPT|nr:CLUMA_CG016193, isoform A [Clunio marinus]
MRLAVKIFFITFVIENFAESFSYQRSFRQSEICGYHNGHRKYLELGDNGEMFASNITIPQNVKDITKGFNQSLTLQCSLELVTCPSCIIKIKFTYANLLSNCEHAKDDSSVCRCDHITFNEPPYNNKQNTVYNCGSATTYRSKTRSVLIKFIYWNNYADAFHFEYVAERNREIITMTPGESTELNNVILESPFFPQPYPRDHSMEHVLTCDIDKCRIRLVFSDFQLSRSSTIEFFDTNGERLFVTGNLFRPPILLSSGPSLMVKFSANDDTDIGYRAKATFLTVEESSNSNLKVQIGCGGLVESVGGAITMMNMVSKNVNESDNQNNFDCIWLVRPPQGYMRIKTHISLKVEVFEKMAGKSEIIIIEGMTSNRPILEQLESSTETSVSSRNLVLPISSGFYIRLRGKFNSESRLAIVYTAFSYSQCYLGDIECQNQRCIPMILKCDGFNQCGDNSDEPETCPNEWANSVVDRRWYSHTPNYYFPKNERFPDFKITTLAFIVSSTSFMFVIVCLIMTIYRNGNRVREQEELQNQLQTISQLLGWLNFFLMINGNNNNNNNREEVIEPPPLYEAPPNYDEVIKIGMDEQINSSKRERRSGRKSRMHRARRSDDPAVSYQNELLQVARDDSDIPSTSSIGSDSSYFYSRNASHDSFLPSIHMLEITETSETTTSCTVEGCGHQTTRVQDFPNAITTRSPFQSSSNDSLNSSSSNFNRSSDNLIPRHLWSDESKFRKSWILFNSDDQRLAPYDKINLTRSPIDGSYQQHESLTTPRDSIVSLNSCFCDSSQSIFSENFKTSLMIQKLECDRCRNLILRQENRRCSMCMNCVEKLYSPKTCNGCNGRISFHDLKLIRMNSDKRVDVTRNYSVDNFNLKLCNCFPKFPSQRLSSIQTSDPNEIQILPQITRKACSYTELLKFQRKKAISPQFHSQSCLPNKVLQSDDSSCGED